MEVLLNQEDIYHIKSGFVAAAAAINEGYGLATCDRDTVVEITTFATTISFKGLGLLGKD